MLLRVGYVGVLLSAAAVSVGVAYWLVSRRDWSDARFLVLHLLTSATWAVVAVAELLLDPFSLVRVAVLVAAVLSMLNVATWGLFVVDYLRIPDPRARRYRQAIGAVSALVIGLMATTPIHRRYYAEIRPGADPFPHPALVEGPLVPVGFGLAYLIVVAGLYGMLRLFVGSRFRSNAAALLLIGGTLVALVPSVASNLGLVPLSDYDHAVFGTPVFATAVAVAAFRTGLPDLTTVARQRLLEKMDDALIAVNADGIVTDHNPPAVDLAAVPGAVLTDEPFRSAFPTVAADLDLTDEPTTATLSVAGDGGTRYYSARVTPLMEGERSLGHLVLLRDVTELERSRRQLQRQNEYLDRFASTLSHELRNPLEIVGGYAAALEDDLDLDGPPERMLGEIREANDRMTEIVADLQTLTEGGVSVESTERVRLSEAVDRVDAPVDVVVERDGVVHADASRLVTVLENLLRNAADHVGPDATVTVGTVEDGFYVEDDGPGVPPGDRERVFSYGYTTSEDGSGIGLALVRVTADAHGWTVRLAPPASDRGARFVFEDVTVDPPSSGGAADAPDSADDLGVGSETTSSPSSPGR